MEPKEATPTRKRRRWLIVAFVLVLVSTVSWWYWPRGDARFVGKWTAGGISPVVTFRPHGIAISERSANDLVFLTWRVEGNRLVIGPDAPDWIEQVFTLAEPWLGLNIYGIQETFEIVDVSATAIRLRGEKGTEDSTLTRIPE